MAREPRDGRLRWWRELPEREAGALRSTGLVLVHRAGNRLTALRATTGAVRGSGHCRGPAAAPGGRQNLFALDRDTGRGLWWFALGTPAGRLLVEGGTVYAAAHRPVQGSLVFALDARTGACAGGGPDPGGSRRRARSNCWACGRRACT
ncbi:outer membrane protein assembly factor BamB family protein [Streptomyces roseus]|uniref:outer membrane protein assembly factor BamB family protein n=1 Tax=Streptomyces roseus TaxID=66430 RepID=UPI003798A89F